MREISPSLPLPSLQPLKLLGQNRPQISKQLCLLATGCPSLQGAGSPQGSGVQQGYTSTPQGSEARPDGGAQPFHLTIF